MKNIPEAARASALEMKRYVNDILRNPMVRYSFINDEKFSYPLHKLAVTIERDFTSKKYTLFKTIEESLGNPDLAKDFYYESNGSLPDWLVQIFYYLSITK